MKHAGTQPIETQRLTLRRFQPSDAQAMFTNWAADPEVTQFLMFDPHTGIGDSQYVTDMWAKDALSESTYRWAICLKDGDPIGSILVNVEWEDDYKAELSYAIGRAFWGQGYTSEAARAVVDYMFTRTDIERIESYNAVANPGSGGVLRNAGLRHEGFARHKYLSKMGFQDCDLFAIVRDEWEQRRT
jgi:ribosomal-protein-alanine N-acetyltransferase